MDWGCDEEGEATGWMGKVVDDDGGRDGEGCDKSGWGAGAWAAALAGVGAASDSSNFLQTASCKRHSDR